MMTFTDLTAEMITKAALNGDRWQSKRTNTPACCSDARWLMR